MLHGFDITYIMMEVNPSACPVAQWLAIQNSAQAIRIDFWEGSVRINFPIFLRFLLKKKWVGNPGPPVSESWYLHFPSAIHLIQVVSRLEEQRSWVDSWFNLHICSAACWAQVCQDVADFRPNQKRMSCLRKSGYFR